MSRYISPDLRKMIAKRAGHRCEYCLLPEIAAMVKFQIEHIISLKHGGKTQADNLAYSCPVCNSEKGTDIGTVLGEEMNFVPFFNPRKHYWHDHFELQDGMILPRTSTGEATIKILKFNTLDRILERVALLEAGVDYSN